MRPFPRCWNCFKINNNNESLNAFLLLNEKNVIQTIGKWIILYASDHKSAFY